MSNLTGYQVHKAANVLLAAEGRPTIQPQLVYNYIKAGRIAIVRKDDGTPVDRANLERGTKYVVTPEEAKRWLASFLSGNEPELSDPVADLLASMREEEA